MKDFKYAIIGGGLQGTHIANKLLSDTNLEHNDVAVFDPQGYGKVFDNRTSYCNTETLRSPTVHHVGEDPFDLESYAKSEGRASELVSEKNNPSRPTTSLFMDHLDYIVDSKNLDECLVHEYVENIKMRKQPILETEKRSYKAENVLLSIGLGEINYPNFAEELPDEANIEHVFEPDFEPENVTDYSGEAIVVGGSITAGQISDYLSRNNEEKVTMLTRSPIHLESVEADPTWMNTRKIGRQLYDLEPEERHRKIQEERYDGSMPSYVWEDVEDCLKNNDLDIIHDEVDSVKHDNKSVTLETKKGRSFEEAYVVLATGFQSIYNHPFVRKTAENLELDSTENLNIPIINDENLRWKKKDGQDSEVQIAGKLAETSLGPFAGNITGARDAANRITGSYQRKNSRVLADD